MTDPAVPSPASTPSRGPAALRRLGAEFVVIVVGVLVAFAVDDWRAGADRREEAVRLIGMMEADIEASVEDLREAAGSAVVRRDAIVELLRLAGQPLPPEGQWRAWDTIDLSELRGAVITAIGDKDFSTLVKLPAYVQVFDPRMAAFDELRSTGGLATIPDPRVRRDITEFFSLILDFAESNQFLRTDQFALQESWQRAGIIAGDWIPQDRFMARLTADVESLAALRRNYVRALEQASGYIMLADSLEAQGARIVEAARGSLGN